MTRSRSATANIAVTIALLALMAWLAWERPPATPGPALAPTVGTRSSEPAATTPSPDPPAPAAGRAAGTIVRDQQIHDEQGRLVYQGDVDLGPVLTRIAAGERDAHRNDGTVFANREGRLPKQPRGYYTEWVVRTAGLRGVGPQRLITGQQGEVFYTPDHYETFIRVREPS